MAYKIIEAKSIEKLDSKVNEFKTKHKKAYRVGGKLDIFIKNNMIYYSQIINY